MTPHFTNFFFSTSLSDIASTTVGQAFAISGNKSDCKIYVTSYSEITESYSIHGLKIVNGTITSSATNQSSEYTKLTWGENIAISISPFSRDNIIIDSPIINPKEFSFNWGSTAKPMTSFMNMPEEVTNLKTISSSFLRFGGQVYSLLPNMDDTYSNLSIKIMDATKGLKALTSVADDLNLFNTSDISTYVTSAATSNKGNIYINVLVSGIGVCKYEIEGTDDDGNTGATDFKLEKIWSFTGVEGNSPANIGGADIQQGAAHNGTFYINDSGRKLIYLHTKDGLLGTIPGGEGWGIATDDAGNIIVRDDKLTGVEHKLLIYPSGITFEDIAPLELDITLNEGGQTNFISASGNVLGNKGGYLYFFSNSQTVVNIVQIKNGEVSSVKTSGTTSVAGSTAGYVIPIRNNSVNWLYQVRADGIYDYNGSDKGVLMGATTNQNPPNANTTLGGEYFTLSHRNILIYNSGKHYLGGFTIKNLTDNKVITSVAPIGTKGYADSDGNKSTANWTFAEKIDAGSYYIYQFCPANGIAVYRFYDANYTPTNIQEPANVNSGVNVLIYPSPASNMLNFKPSEIINNVTVYSISGTILKQVKGYDLKSINIENLDKGYYLIKMNNTTTQFIKN